MLNSLKPDLWIEQHEFLVGFNHLSGTICFCMQLMYEYLLPSSSTSIQLRGCGITNACCINPVIFFFFFFVKRGGAGRGMSSGQRIWQLCPCVFVHGDYSKVFKISNIVFGLS